MRTLRLIDIEVALPEDLALETRRPQDGIAFHGISGPSAAQVRDRVEASAAVYGYELERAPQASHLLRRKQRISMLVPNPTQLDITVDDPEVLPTARIDSRGIVLGQLSIEITASRIVPLKERHDEGSSSWSAEWNVYGKRVDELCSQIHEELVQKGLRSNGIWGPPKGGIQRWHVEAYSPRRLVKAYISDEGDHLTLALTLDDDTEDT